MSYTNEQLRFIEDARADILDLAEKGFLSDARKGVDNLGELGYETEAMFLHRELNRIETYRPEDDFGGKSGEPTDPWVASEDRAQDIDSHIYAQADY